jgi:hypothetical protein
MTRWLLRLARWIGGRNRAEWAEAMEAETAAAGPGAIGWAWGSLAALLVDRIGRSARIMVIVTLLPVVAMALEFALFFPSAWIFRVYDLPRWTILSLAIFTPLPVAMLLGWLTAGRGALAPAIAAFLVAELLAMLQWWLFFGQGPSVFFDGSIEIHHLHAQVGQAIHLAIWLLGAAIGARWHGSRHHTDR